MFCHLIQKEYPRYLYSHVLRTIVLTMIMLLNASLYAQVRVAVEQPIIPVLIGKPYNPVLKLTFIKNEVGNAQVRNLSFSIKGDINSVAYITLYPADRNGKIAKDSPLSSSQKANKTICFTDPVFLTQDTTTVWVSLTLKKSAKLKHKVMVDFISAFIDNEQPVEIENKAELKDLRLGVALRTSKKDNIHTSRIPGIATTKKNTLLAIYDARYNNSRDLQGNIDIALNRSCDGGATWQPTQIVLDQKNWGNLPEKFNGVSDACILVDDQTGTIYIAGLWMHGILNSHTGKWIENLSEDSDKWNHQWMSKGSQPGTGVKETSQFLITQSTDDGLTWSDPINLTEQTKRTDWWLFAPAPGHGITLQDGTLVFPTQGRDNKGVPFSNITYSKDGGKTWTASNPAYTNTTECMAVELNDGSIMLNMRDNRNRGNTVVNGRRICTTQDLGETWTEHPTSRKALIEPTCMASLHKHVYQGKRKKQSVLLFCNPESCLDRSHMTLKVSFDDGNSWPSSHKILLDEWAGFGYSCITSIDEKTIGVIYESSQAQLVFQQIDLQEILQK